MMKKPRKNKAPAPLDAGAKRKFIFSSEGEQRLRVVRHHPFFVGRNDQYVDAAVAGADHDVVTRIGFQEEAWSLSLGDPDFAITLCLGVAATNRCCRFPSFGTTLKGSEYAYRLGDSWHYWLPFAPIHLATS